MFGPLGDHPTKTVLKHRDIGIGLAVALSNLYGAM